MKKFDLRKMAERDGGEYVLGSADLSTHACYCIYGILKAGESGRRISPGSGHEEIVCLVQGTVVLSGGEQRFTLGKGEAFYLRGDDQYIMDNAGDGEALYVIAGGHSGGHEHGHE